MSIYKKRDKFYSMFINNDKNDLSLINLLDGSSCDEVVFVDLNNDTFNQIYHVDGKYFIPMLDGFSFKGLFKYCYEHIVYFEDRDIFKELMDPSTIMERLKNSEIPNFIFAQFRYKLQDGSYRWVEQCCITGKEYGFEEGTFKIYIFDIQNLKSREIGEIYKEIDMQEGKDNPHGLYREKEFFHAAQKIVDKNKDKKWCLIALDIEHFKLFDDWYGRETGDYLLTQIGAVLLEGENKHVALGGYFGQDDFGILMEFNKEYIEELFEEIRSVIVSFGLSIGFMPAFGVAPVDNNIPVVDVFDKASIASSKAKSDIKNRICYYTQDMRLVAENEIRVLNDFMQALKNDEIVFYLQPQCRISTGKVVGAESLARWIRKDGKINPPDTFIPILEKYGFIIDLDKYLWEKVCIWLRKWLDGGHKAVPISLNVSRADIFTVDIAKHFVELTEKYNIPHNLIKLEITESAYAETTLLIEELVKKLRELGFLVLMDDFGSGYSSLNMLSNFEVDAIKLDAKFLHIENADKDKGIHILESVVNMAKMIAVPIIVEGVENQKQSDFLEELGCRYVQGYHFYRPMPVQDFENLIRDEEKIDGRGFVVKLNEQFRIREFLDKNVYSDSMLNNIIGAVALYSWDGENTDIVRFNQQFYESVDVPDFMEKLANIERVMPPEDVPVLHSLFKEAKEHRLSGSSGMVRFYKVSGILTAYDMHFYYLGVKEGKDRFYGSAHNITKLVDLEQKISLLKKYSNTSVIFIKNIENQWVYEVAMVRKLEGFGLTIEEFEKELNEGTFRNRIKSKKEKELFASVINSLKKDKNMQIKIHAVDNNNKKRLLSIRFDYVRDETNNIIYVCLPIVLD